MTGTSFAADWLDRRSPYDAAATSRGEAAVLARRFGTVVRRRRERAALVLLDLGGGTGANVCRLAPVIHGSQSWTVVDRDHALLDRVGDTVARWGRSIGGRLTSVPGGIAVTTPQRIVTVTGRVHDLRDGLAGLPLDTADGVAGAALLDLVSSSWLAAAVADLAMHRLPALFTLNVDGRMAWTPAASDDAAIASAFGRDLQRDKGFGPALGPHAATVAAARFAAHGYTVDTARADWLVRGGDGAMHRALLSFVVPAAQRQPPAEAAAGWHASVDAWAESRLASAAHGTLELAVGHTDVLAVM